MFGAILGGIGAIASAFGGSKKQETTTTSHVDYRRMVREAEAAGFNPLTALRNGGSAGFSVQSSVTPALSSAHTIANALGEVGSFVQNFDPMADDRKQLEFDLVQAQLENLQANTAATRRSMSFNVPTWTAGETHQRMGSSRGAGGKSWDGSPMTPEAMKPASVNPWTKDSGIMVDPSAPNAEDWEARYGDGLIGDGIGGAVTFGRDLRYNIINNLGVPEKWISPKQWDWPALSIWNHDGTPKGGKRGTVPVTHLERLEISGG